MYYEPARLNDAIGARFVIIALQLTMTSFRAIAWSFALIAIIALLLGSWNLATILVERGIRGFTAPLFGVDLLLMILWWLGLVAAVGLMNRRDWGRRLLRLVAGLLAVITVVHLAWSRLHASPVGSLTTLEWTLSAVGLLYLAAVAACLSSPRLAAITREQERQTARRRRRIKGRIKER